MPQKTEVHSFYLDYEENAIEGMRYLRDNLDYNEAKVFFDQARLKGFAEFEDSQDRRYTLIYKAGNYSLVRR